jgi:hypothetical protein
MNKEESENKSVFRYNMSFYYQSTIIYFIAFIVYLVVRGEFVEDSFTLITKDPIIYFFGIIVLISLITLIYNIYKNLHLTIGENEISFVDRFKTRSFSFNDISIIKISRRKKRRERSKAFRLIRIKLKNKKRPLIIRPYDYENEDALVKKIHEIKERLEKETDV